MNALTQTLPVAASGDEAGDQDLKRALAATLYASPKSMAAGAFAGAAVGLTVAATTAHVPTLVLGLAVPIIGVTRVLQSLRVRNRSRRPGRPHLDAAFYEIGAWLYSAILGLLAFSTLTYTDQPGLHLLVTALSIGYAAGICARNAARPRVALGQLVLSVLPVSAALLTSDDPARWVLAAVNLIFVFGLADITRTTYATFRAALVRARAQEQEYRATLDQLPVMAWTADRAGYTTYQSRCWSEFTGTAEIGSGNTKVGLVHPSDWPLLDEAWAQAVRTGADFKTRYRLLHRSGTYRWVMSSGRPERDSSGAIVRWHGACVDIEDLVSS